MSDLIDRMEAAEAIARTKIYGDFDTDYARGLTEGLLEAIRKIRDLPAANQWIPVTDKLPENKVKKMVTLSEGTVTIGAYDEREKCWWIIDGWRIQRANCIEAWMPLPEPYEEDDNE